MTARQNTNNRYLENYSLCMEMLDIPSIIK